MANLNGAIQQAISICWNETIGYYFGGYQDSTGYDCSGLICRCLHDNGFNVTNTRVGTGILTSHLQNAGFQTIPYTTGMQMQPGDIVNINDGSYGHSYFYMENVNGYSDYPTSPAPDYASNVTNTIVLLPYAKIEAFSKLGHSGSGDVANSHGAHCEVWVHRLNPNNITNGHPANTCYISRWPGGMIDDGVLGALLLFKLGITR